MNHCPSSNRRWRRRAVPARATGPAGDAGHESGTAGTACTGAGRATRVLVADGHAPTRRLVGEMLVCDGYVVCGEAATGRAAVSAACTLRPDACIVDSGLRGGGVEAARSIMERLPATRVLVTTVVDDVSELLEVLAADAAGYLVKPVDHASLAGAVQASLRGEIVIPRHLVPGLVRRREQAPRAAR